MNKDYEFLIAGGDLRQLYMEKYLKNLGYRVCSVFLTPGDGNTNENLKNLIRKSKYIILPLPVSRDRQSINTSMSEKKLTFAAFADCIENGDTVFAGMADDKFRTALEMKGAVVHDYFKREDLAFANAVPTAEGVVSVIKDNVPFTIHSSRTAVTGYGRCGAATANLLKAMNSRVTVSVRSSAQYAKAKADGHKVCFLKDLANHAGEFDIIINTVPAPVIGRDILNRVRRGTLIIETASAPFGVDFESAREMDIKVIKASSLPGKTAPAAAGKIIADVIIQMIREG